MTDRELLEAAARAAGLRITWGEKYFVGGDEVDCTDLPYVVSDDREESPAYWNPLEDDGDALRLAVKLDLLAGPEFWHEKSVQLSMAALAGDRQDHYAATRRAIVRAAAMAGVQCKGDGK